MLLVDDEPLVLQMLHDLLVDGPFAIETATDGYEALVRVLPETRDVRILGVTRHPSMVPVLLGAGADACVTKPLDLDVVCREITRLTSAAAVSHSLTGREG